MATVVEECVYGLLEHALFVANDHIRRLQLEKIFKTIIPVDHPAIKIVEIAGGKASAFERDERPEIWRNDRKNFQNHPLGSGVRGSKALGELESLREFFANLFALGVPHRFFEFLLVLGEVDSGEKFPNGVCAHPSGESFTILLDGFSVFGFGEQLRFGEGRLAWVDDQVVLVVDDAFELATAHIEHQANP